MKENMNLFLDIKADQIPTTDLKSVVVTKQKSN